MGFLGLLSTFYPDVELNALYALSHIAVQDGEILRCQSLQFGAPTKIGNFYLQNPVGKIQGSGAGGNGLTARQRPRQHRSLLHRSAAQAGGDNFFESRTGVFHGSGHRGAPAMLSEEIDFSIMSVRGLYERGLPGT